MENNNIDQFYKESLSSYETGVSGSFWLRLKLRLLWLDTKIVLLGLGALLLIGTSIFSGFYFYRTTNLPLNEKALYQSRGPEAMSTLLVMNETESLPINHPPIIVEPVFNEPAKTGLDISHTAEKKSNPVSTEESGFIESSETRQQSAVLFTPALSGFVLPKDYDDKIYRDEMEIDPLTGLNLLNISELETHYDTVLSPYFIKQKKTWFSLSLYAAPAYTMAQLNSVSMDDEYMNYRKDHETATLSWSAGLDVQLNLKNWYIQSGLVYSTFSSERNYNHSFLALDSLNTYYAVDTTWGVIFDPPDLGKPVVIGIDSTLMPTYNDMNEGVNEWRYFEIPLVVGYKFNLNRLSIDIGTGFSYGYLLSVKGNVPSLANNNSFDELSDMNNQINRNQFNYILQFGVSYYLTPKWSVIAQPYYKQNLLSVFNNSYPVEQHFRAIGVKIGLKIDL